MLCYPFSIRGRCVRLVLAALLLLGALVQAKTVHAQAGGAGGSGGAGAGGGGGTAGSVDPEPMPFVTKLHPNSVVSGSSVTVEGENLPLDPTKISVELGGFDLGNPVHVAPDQKSFDFIVPRQARPSGSTAAAPLPIGRQLLVRVTITLPKRTFESMTTKPYEAGFLNITTEARPPLKLTGIEPAVVTPATPHLVLMGEGLGGDPSNYVLLRDGREIPLCWQDDKACTGLSAKITSPYQLELSGFYDKDEKLSDEWREEHVLGLRLGDAVSNLETKKVRFITCTPVQVQTWAILVTLALLGLIVIVAFWGGGMQKLQSVRTRPARYVRAFLLDPETDTYSLSKFQFYAWSTAALIGYCYLTLSRALAQGKLDIMDIPENLPGIIAISAGTTVASMGIAATRGPKGAGPVHPSFSDLISTGGIVAPERFQFFLWTLVAIATFLFTVSNSDPSIISDLPKIPPRLLWISGVSAMGYLGGKVARAPGPIIDQIIATTGSLKLSIMGRNLSGDATVEIAGISTAAFLDPTKHPEHRPEAASPSDDDNAGSNTLELLLKKAPVEWVGKATLDITVQNPDGQKATWPVSLDEKLQAELKTMAEATANESKVPPQGTPPIQVMPVPSTTQSTSGPAEK